MATFNQARYTQKTKQTAFISYSAALLLSLSCAAETCSLIRSRQKKSTRTTREEGRGEDSLS
jgi:hypothetical protein